MPAPVVLFAYNRPNHLQLTIESLKKNDLVSDTDVIIYADAPKSSKHLEEVELVRQYIRTVDGFKSVTIIERDENWGLARSIIDGVTATINHYGRVIVIEDDLVTSKYFLRYMNEGLDFYADNQDVASIHGYVYPISGLSNTFFLRGADCWGWATWKDRWELFEPDGSKLLKDLTEKNLLKKFDFNGAYSFSGMLKAQINGLNNSWAIRWHASMFLLNKFTLYPGKSLVSNIGNDGTGIHCESTEFYSGELSDFAVDIKAIPVEESKQAYMQFEKFFRKRSPVLLTSLITKTRSLCMRFFS
jgi:hypothetical protein